MIKIIQSRSNENYKTLRSQLKDRNDPRLWLEGRHLCQEYLARVGQPELAVFDATRLEAGDPELLALQHACQAPSPAAQGATAVSISPPEDGLMGQVLATPRSADCARPLMPSETEVWQLPPALLEGLSAIAAAQGVAFLAARPAEEEPAAIRHDCVILDRLQDPGNAGSIVRTCAAAGIRTLVTLAGGASAWAPKVLRAGQGAHFALQIFDQVSPAWLQQRLAIPLAVTALEQGIDLYEAQWHHPQAWMFGHEGQGVAPSWLAQAQRRVFIPQTAGVESLNVAAAAAICLFEQRRQRLASDREGFAQA